MDRLVAYGFILIGLEMMNLVFPFIAACTKELCKINGYNSYFSLLSICIFSYSTNIPVELIGFFNCPYPKKQKSFVPHEDVLEFYQSYASQYNLDRIIKFRNHVVNVKPKPNNRWEVSQFSILIVLYSILYLEKCLLLRFLAKIS